MRGQCWFLMTFQQNGRDWTADYEETDPDENNAAKTLKVQSGLNRLITLICMLQPRGKEGVWLWAKRNSAAELGPLLRAREAKLFFRTRQ